MLSKNLENSLRRAVDYALSLGHEHTTLEHLLYSLTEDPDIVSVLKSVEMNIEQMREMIWDFVARDLTYLKVKELEESSPTIAFQRVLHRAILQAQTAGRKVVDSRYVLAGIFDEKESHAVFFLKVHNLNRLDIVQYMNSNPLSTKRGSSKKNTDLTRSIQQLTKLASVDSKVQMPGFPSISIEGQTAASSQDHNKTKNLKQF